MSPRRARWVSGAVAALAVAVAVVVWLQWPRDPRPVAVGSLEFPASYGEEFRIISADGDIRNGSILGMTEFPSNEEGQRCFVAVGVVRLTHGEVQQGDFGGVFVSAVTSRGELRGGSSACPSDGEYSSIDQLLPYGLSASAGDTVGRYQLFYEYLAVGVSDDPVGLAVSGSSILLDSAKGLDPHVSIYEFRVTQTFGIHGAA